MSDISLRLKSNCGTVALMVLGQFSENVGVSYLIHRAHLIGEMSKCVTIMEMYS
jgi:hypothetical protein